MKFNHEYLTIVDTFSKFFETFVVQRLVALIDLSNKVVIIAKKQQWQLRVSATNF